MRPYSYPIYFHSWKRAEVQLFAINCPDTLLPIQLGPMTAQIFAFDMLPVEKKSYSEWIIRFLDYKAMTSQRDYP